MYFVCCNDGLLLSVWSWSRHSLPPTLSDSLQGLSKIRADRTDCCLSKICCYNFNVDQYMLQNFFLYLSGTHLYIPHLPLLKGVAMYLSSCQKNVGEGDASHFLAWFIKFSHVVLVYLSLFSSSSVGMEGSQQNRGGRTKDGSSLGSEWLCGVHPVRNTLVKWVWNKLALFKPLGFFSLFVQASNIILTNMLVLSKC